MTFRKITFKESVKTVPIFPYLFFIFWHAFEPNVRNTIKFLQNCLRFFLKNSRYILSYGKNMFFAPEILEKITFFSTIVFRDMSNHLRLKWLKDGVLINSRWFLATLDIGITYILHSVKFENIKEHKYDCCEYIQTPRFLWNAQFCHFWPFFKTNQNVNKYS